MNTKYLLHYHHSFFAADRASAVAHQHIADAVSLVDGVCCGRDSLSFSDTGLDSWSA